MFSQFKGLSAFDDSGVAFELGFSDLELDSVILEDVFHIVSERSFMAEVDFVSSYCKP